MCVGRSKSTHSTTIKTCSGTEGLHSEKAIHILSLSNTLCLVDNQPIAKV